MQRASCPCRSRPRWPWHVASFSRRRRLSRRQKESQDLAHDALSLIRLKKVLRVRRAIEDDQLLGFRGFLMLLANPGKSRSIGACVVAGHDEQCGCLGGKAGQAPYFPFSKENERLICPRINRKYRACPGLSSDTISLLLQERKRCQYLLRSS